MKKFLILLAVLGLMPGPNLLAQDYIINWNNDTIHCRLPASAKEIGLKPRSKYQNGYTHVMVLFPNDSLRVIKAGDIKGYTRAKHGKDLLCDGYFEAKRIEAAARTQVVGREVTGADQEKNGWLFVSRLVGGTYLSLYISYEPGNSTPRPRYYINYAEGQVSQKITPVYTKKKLVKMLSRDNWAASIKDFRYRRTSKGFYDIINEYNRLRQATISKMQP